MSEQQQSGINVFGFSQLMGMGAIWVPQKGGVPLIFNIYNKLQ